MQYPGASRQVRPDPLGCMSISTRFHLYCMCLPPSWSTDSNCPIHTTSINTFHSIARYSKPTVQCGEGQQVGRLEGIFSFPGQPTVQCDVLELANRPGRANPSGYLPILTRSLISLPCACRPFGPPIPTAPFTPSFPTPSTRSPVAPTSCSVCGESQQMGHPEGVFTFSGQPSIQCDVLEQAGQEGLIVADQCPFLPSIISLVCACQPIAPFAPVAEVINSVSPNSPPPNQAGGGTAPSVAISGSTPAPNLEVEDDSGSSVDDKKKKKSRMGMSSSSDGKGTMKKKSE